MITEKHIALLYNLLHNLLDMKINKSMKLGLGNKRYKIIRLKDVITK